MAGAAELLVVVRARNEAKAALNDIQKDLKGVGGQADNSHGSLSKLGGMMGTGLKVAALAGGTAIAGLGTAAIKMGMDFEKSFAEVKTLLPQMSEEGFGKLQGDLLGFSKDLGIATSQSVPALYQAISAGVPPDNVIDFMKVAAKASIGGVTDLTTAVDGITSVVNAYGSSVIDAGKASDVMFTAVKLGKTDFTQLSSSLFNVIPTAASLGVSFEDVASQLAVITAAGTPTSVATTQIRAAMVEAGKTGTKLDVALRDLAGVGFADLIKGGKSMPEVFEMLRQSMPEQNFKDLFGSVEALNSVLGVTGPNFAKASAAMGEMNNAAGATDAAFKTVSETFSFKLNKFLNEAKITLMELGLEALPYVEAAFDKMGQAIQAASPYLADLRRALKDVATASKPVVDAFIVVGKWFVENPEAIKAAAVGMGAVLVVAFTAWAVAAGAAAAATIAAAAPVIALGVVIAALAAGVYLLITNWDEITAKVPLLQSAIDLVIGFITKVAVPVIESLITAMGAVISFVSDNWQLLLGLFLLPFAPLILIATDMFGIRSLFETAITDVISFVSDNWQLLLGLFLLPFAPLILIATDMFGIRSLFETAITDVIGWMPTVWDTVSGIVTAPFELILEVAKDLFGVKTAITGGFDAAKQFVTDNWPIIAAIISGPFAPLVLLATDAFGIRSALEGAITGTKEFISGQLVEIVGFFGALPGEITGALGDLGSTLWQAGKDLIGGFVTGIIGAGNFAADIAGNIGAAIKSWINQNVIDRINRALEFTIKIKNPIGPDPSVTINPPDIPYLAGGGIVTRPTFALIGERGPEAVIPLTGRDRRGFAGAEVHVHFHSPVLLGDERQAEYLAERIGQILQRKARTAGAVGMIA